MNNNTDYTEQDVQIWWDDQASMMNMHRVTQYVKYYAECPPSEKHDIEMAYKLYIRGKNKLIATRNTSGKYI